MYKHVRSLSRAGRAKSYCALACALHVELPRGRGTLASAYTQLHTATIVSNTPVNEGIYELVLKCKRLADTIRPGEFVDIQVPGDATHLIRIPLSYSHVMRAQHEIVIAYAAVGEGTQRLSRLQPGTPLSVIGPCGHGWELPASSAPALLISGGIGAPPILACAELLQAAHVPVQLILGAQNKHKLWGYERAHELGISQVIVTTDDGSCGKQGFTTDAMKELMAQHEFGSIYTCGPQVMMKAIAKEACARSIDCQVSMERMMTCGFGACATCNVTMKDGSNKGCCMCGPVFDAKEIAW